MMMCTCGHRYGWHMNEQRPEPCLADGCGCREFRWRRLTHKAQYHDYGRKVFIVSKDRPKLYGPFVWVHSDPKGAPVLLGDSSWRTVSGCQLRIGRYTFWFQFRRFYKS